MTSRPSQDSHASPIPEVTLSLDPAEQNGQPAHSADRQSHSNLPPNQQSHPVPGPLHLSDRHFDTDDLPSPPYKRVPSASNLKSGAQPTPPYRSSSSIDLMEKPVLDDKGRFPEQHDASNEQQNAKPTVHYHQDTNSPAPEYAGGPSRTNSFPLQHSRQPSYATSDDGEDDDEDYDWSAEEDLVDEEAKFESQMGIKQKRKGWGPKRSVVFIDLPPPSIPSSRSSRAEATSSSVPCFRLRDVRVLIFSIAMLQDLHPSVRLLDRINVRCRPSCSGSHPCPLLLVQTEPDRSSTLRPGQYRGMALLGCRKCSHFMVARYDH